MLAEYIRAKRDFEIMKSIDGSYGHMGATLTDAVLQAGVRYETVVRPRVLQLLNDHLQEKTTGAFADLLASAGGGKLLKWNGEQKLATLAELTGSARRHPVCAGGQASCQLSPGIPFYLARRLLSMRPLESRYTAKSLASTVRTSRTPVRSASASKLRSARSGSWSAYLR